MTFLQKADSCGFDQSVASNGGLHQMHDSEAAALAATMLSSQIEVTLYRDFIMHQPVRAGLRNEDDFDSLVYSGI
jgi:hypothetical protein